MKSLGKKLCRGWFITGVILASIFGGCGKEVDEEPLLIAPEDGAVFDLKAPVFVWHSYGGVDAYVLHVSKDAFIIGELLLEDTLVDTTYAMPEEIFEWALNGDYIWSVASLIDSDKVGWWEFRSFSIDKPPLKLSLDSTYFPLGLDYQWVYERHGCGYYYDPTQEYDYDNYDTITICVTDSAAETNDWRFVIGGGSFRDGTPFSSEGDTIYVFWSRVLVFDNYKIPLLPESTAPKGSNEGLEIIYEKDKLCITLKESYYYGPVSVQYYKWSTSRLKGTGVVSQGYYASYMGHSCGDAQNIEDRLLYFIKDGDTVWRADKQP